MPLIYDTVNNLVIENDGDCGKYTKTNNIDIKFGQCTRLILNYNNLSERRKML